MAASVHHRLSVSLLASACAAVLLAACGGGSSSTDAAATGTATSNSYLSQQGAVEGTATTASSTDSPDVSSASAAASTTDSTTPASTSADSGTASPASTTTSSTTGSVTSADATPTTPTTTSATSTSTGSSSTSSSSGSTATSSGSNTAAAATPYGQDASAYTLTFSEEFNSWNSNLWNDQIWYSAGNATKNYTVENGVLKIWPQRDASGNFFDRTIDTDGKYYQTYGYFEMEAKLPKGKGTWPAFWLFNHIGSRRPEMDIMEAYAGGNGWGYTDSSGVAIPNTYAATVWKGDVDGQQMGFKMYNAGVDLSAGFHKYAVKWEPNKQTYYFDGKAVLTVNVAMTDPMYIMLDLWFGSASGTPDNSTPQGKANSYEVNYVRAWQFK